MKKINPMTIVLISLLFAVLSLVLLKQSTTKLKEQNSILIDTKTIANQYSSLKKSWNNPKQISKIINKIKRQLRLKKLSIVDNKKKITITIKNETLNNINKFINKICNANLIILKLNIKKDSVYLEIGK